MLDVLSAVIDEVLRSIHERRRRRRAREVMEHLRGVACHLGFPPPTLDKDEACLAALSEGFVVELRESISARTARLEVGRRDMARALALRAAQPEEARLGLSPLHTGDRDFDRHLVIEGDEALAAALLGQPARAALLPALREGLMIKGGGIARAGPSTLLDAVPIKRRIEDLKQLAIHLLAPADLLGRLIETADRDPQPGVRAHVLEVLGRHFPERALSALRDGLLDGDERVRLSAAAALGEEGTPELVRLTSNEHASNAVRRRAIALLGRRLPIADLASLLRTALDRDPETVVEGAIEALAEVAERQRTDLAPSAQAALIAALDHPAKGTRTAAARALGDHGSIGAVPALEAAVYERVLDFDFDLVARSAIGKIQARAAGERGLLSLASEGGELSLGGPHASGGVSLAADETD